MLEISRKKLRTANMIYYGSIVLMLAYIVLSIMWGWPRPIVLVFLVPLLYGGNARTSLYKCPNCGRRLLSGASRKEIRTLTPPSVCPECETPIEIKFVD